MRKLLFTSLILAFASLCAWAQHDFIQDGIYYKVNSDGRTATVTYPDNGSHYSGHIEIPSKVTASRYNGGTYTVTAIDDGAFKNCANLTGVEIPSSVATIGSEAFFGCTRLTSLAIPSGVSSIGYWAFYESGLVSVTVPSTVTEMGDAVFRNCAALKTVTLSDNITTIGTEMFFNCPLLEEIVIPAKVTSIGYYAFHYCASLKRVVIPASLEWYDENPFLYCTALLEFVVDSKNSSYSSIDGVLFDKEGATLLCFPSGKAKAYSVPEGVTDIADEAFAHNDKITKVIFPSTLLSIGLRAFEECTALEEVCFPKNMQFDYVGTAAFLNCTRLKSFSYPAGTTFAIQCLYGCTALEEVAFPASVDMLDTDMFPQCTSLKRIYCLSPNPAEIEPSTFAEPYSRYTIYVPTGAKAKYMKAEHWKQMNIVEMSFEQVGDVDGNAAVNVSDVTALINRILGTAALCPISCDVDGNGQINVSDITTTINCILAK